MNYPAPEKKRGVRITNGELHVPLAMAAKIGSIIVHADEALSAGGHTFDVEAMRPLLNDADVRAFCAELGPLVPRKRCEPPANSAAAHADPETQYQDAVVYVIENQKASTSFVQRKLQCGYNLAARLLERMVEEKIVSAPGIDGRRDVLISAATLASSRHSETKSNRGPRKGTRR